MMPLLKFLLKRRQPNVIATDVRHSTANATAYTFSACQIDLVPNFLPTQDGVGNPTFFWPRMIPAPLIVILAFSEDSAATFSVSSITIGGVAGDNWFDSNGPSPGLNIHASVWGSDQDLRSIANTDVVVNHSEAVTSCSIVVLSIDNVQTAAQFSAAGAPVSTGDVTINQTIPDNVAPLSAVIFASICGTGGGTESVDFTAVSSGPGWRWPTLLNYSSNAEHDIAVYAASAPGFLSNAAEADWVFRWSGAGSATAMMLGFR